jgi:hypothetical protein
MMASQNSWKMKYKCDQKSLIPATSHIKNASNHQFDCHGYDAVIGSKKKALQRGESVDDFGFRSGNFVICVFDARCCGFVVKSWLTTPMKVESGFAWSISLYTNLILYIICNDGFNCV